jgi:hypothetical protein
VEWLKQQVKWVGGELTVVISVLFIMISLPTAFLIASINCLHVTGIIVRSSFGPC